MNFSLFVIFVCGGAFGELLITIAIIFSKLKKIRKYGQKCRVCFSSIEKNITRSIAKDTFPDM